MYVALKAPFALRATVRPLDLVWPFLKFTVEVFGVAVETGPR